MAVSFELPGNIEQSLRSKLGDLNQVAKEAALVELYRHGKLTHVELSEALGLSRLETEDVLKSHHVTEDLPTEAELGEDVTNLRRLLGK